MYVSSVLYFIFSVLCLLKMSIVRWFEVFQVPVIQYHSYNQHKKMSQTSLAMHTCLHTANPCPDVTLGTNRQLTRIRRQYCDTAYLLGIVIEICFEHMNKIYIFFSPPVRGGGVLQHLHFLAFRPQYARGATRSLESMEFWNSKYVGTLYFQLY